LDGGPARRKAATYTATQKQNKRTQTSIPRVGFEPTILVFGRAKTVHALERAATVIGSLKYNFCKYGQVPCVLSFLHSCLVMWDHAIDPTLSSFYLLFIFPLNAPSLRDDDFKIFSMQFISVHYIITSREKN
jgi:hypothetical protein